MHGHATLVFCAICGTAVSDRGAKEALYQVDRVRYRVDLCPVCLDTEMKRHGAHRGVPGFRKRAAVAFTVHSPDDVPGSAGSSTAGKA